MWRQVASDPVRREFGRLRKSPQEIETFRNYGTASPRLAGVLRFDTGMSSRLAICDTHEERRVDDDAQLLEDLRRGRPRAIDELSRRYRARIVSLAMRYVRNLSDAEDLAQDVLLKVWRHVGRFQGEPRLWPWIARITANTAISHLRARRRRPLEPLGPVDETSSAFPETAHPSDGQLLADDQAVLAQFREHAALALGRIPANYRDAVVLMDLRQCSTREASASLGIPVPTVKSRAIRGRRLLRHQLAAFQGGLGLRVPSS